MVKINLELLEGARAPERKKGDAGWDCFIRCFCYYEDGKIVESDYQGADLNHGGRLLAKLGFKTEIPEGYYAQLVPRSGFALKYGMTITNTPATIDSSYRGEWMAILSKLFEDEDDYYGETYEHSLHLSVGDKICQFIIRKEVDTSLTIVKSLSKSARGSNGFGSSGN